MQGQFDVEMPDDDAYEGPDGYVEGDIEEELDIEVEEEEAEADRYEESIQSIMGAFIELQQNAQGGNANPAVQTNVTLRDLSRILGMGYEGTERASVVDNEDEDEDEDDVDYEDDDDDYAVTDDRHNWYPQTTEPRKEGVELLMGGEFGRVGNKIKSRSNTLNIYRTVRDSRMRLRPAYKEDVACDLVPNSNGTAVASYDHNAYAGQFSTDSSFYYTCVQDFSLHVYDMTAPPTRYEPNRERTTRTRARRYMTDSRDDHQTTMKVMNTIQGHPGRWTITDSHLSPDNEKLIYASISPIVYMTNVRDTSSEQIPLRFSDPPRRQHVWGFDDDRFGIWSCRFSADGSEVVAGGDGKIFVYDLKADRRTVKIEAHGDDVNSCCWADTASGNILISASDDSFIKVWDRRSLGSSHKPSGVLVGHTEGITSVAAKGDGRYVISNGKDQALRLWDLRKMHSSADFDSFSGRSYGISQFDYRYGHYPKPRYQAHPKDCSVMTYRGHAVLKTLIRCHFSPAETTGSQYLYSGSADGKIHIWSLDGRVIQVLDRAHTLPLTFDPSDKELPGVSNEYRDRTCVRDVSWHSKEPVLMSVGWNGGRGSIVARHEWKGLLKMGNNLSDWTEKQKSEREERAKRRAGHMTIPGAFTNSDESDDE